MASFRVRSASPHFGSSHFRTRRKHLRLPQLQHFNRIIEAGAHCFVLGAKPWSDNWSVASSPRCPAASRECAARSAGAAGDAGGWTSKQSGPYGSWPRHPWMPRGPQGGKVLPDRNAGVSIASRALMDSLNASRPKVSSPGVSRNVPQGECRMSFWHTPSHNFVYTTASHYRHVCGDEP